jgi:L-ribulose-5-phosphate 3-epimerase
MQPEIRYGVTQWSLDGDGPETILRAAELGFRSIHLSSGALDGRWRLDGDGVRAAYVRAASEAEVRIDALSPGDLNDLGLGSPKGSATADRCALSIRIAVDAALDMGVPLVFLPSFRAGEIRTDVDLRRTAEVLSETCELVSGTSVTIATENTLSVDGNRALLETSGRPELRVLLDTQNPALWGHVPASFVDGLWPRLADQVHVKDGVEGVMGNATLGKGDAGFSATADSLLRNGFAGALISENDYHGERRALAARDLAVLTELFGSGRG